MKLLRYGEAGAERPGLLDAKGILRDLSGHCADIDFVREPNLIERLAGISPSSLAEVNPSVRLGAPVAGVRKFIGIGLNYHDHAVETNAAIPKEPVVFTKANSCLSGPYDRIVMPPDSKKTDWEVELGIVIGRRTSYIPETEVRDHLAGYLVVNDVSEREYQMERGPTWDKGKGCDSFGPIGPWFVTNDEVPDCQALDLWLDVNGQPMQRGNTKNMIFSCVEIVSYLSRLMTLMPGDIITTGTPGGVGMARKPQVFLKAGDVVTLGLTALGEQRQEVVAYGDSAARQI